MLSPGARWLRLGLIALRLGALFLVVAVTPVGAFEGRSGEDVVIRNGEVVNDDLYVAATTITIDGTVNGDALLIGRMVVVNGTINGGLWAVAQSVIVNGTVRDSARVGGQAVQLDTRAKVGRDLLFLGQSLENRAGSSVGNDLLLGGSQALLAGSVGRNLTGGMEGLDLRGSVGGNVDVAVGEGGELSRSGTPPPEIGIPVVKSGLRVADTARIGGKLTYSSDRTFPMGNQAAGGVERKTPEVREERRDDTTSRLLDALRHLVALVAIGLLLVWLAPGWVRRLAQTVAERPGPSLGWGVIACAAIVIAVIGLLIAVVLLAIVFDVLTLGNLVALEIALGALGIVGLAVAFALFTSFVAQAVVAVLAGRLILRPREPERFLDWLPPLLLGAVLLGVATALPGIGGLVGLAISLVGLGALWLLVIAPLSEPRPPPLAPSPASS